VQQRRLRLGEVYPYYYPYYYPLVHLRLGEVSHREDRAAHLVRVRARVRVKV